jgi:hypothetical protein
MNLLIDFAKKYLPSVLLGLAIALTVQHCQQKQLEQLPDNTPSNTNQTNSP